MRVCTISMSDKVGAGCTLFWRRDLYTRGCMATAVRLKTRRQPGYFFQHSAGDRQAQMLRAVLEGICFHQRWMLECEEKKTKTSPVIRFVGGGALSKVTCQMLADITGRTVETVENTKDVGAIGAAMLAAVGSGLFPSLTLAAAHVKVNGRYEPNAALKPVYDRNYRVFRQLYASNKKNFALLNKLKECISMEDQALRMCICKTGRELLENRLVARTWGNVSARADDMHYLVTPSGMDYGSIMPEDIALCDLGDGKWTGPRRPSGERAVHALAYSMFEDAHFVIHTHQTYASALGLCGYKPGCFTGEERQQLGGVAVAGYGLPGTKTLQNAMREAMAHGAKTILMAHHGVLICARAATTKR